MHIVKENCLAILSRVAFIYSEIQAFGAHNLQLTNPQITRAGLEWEEITNVGLGLEHTQSNSVPKPVLRNLYTQM